MPRNARSYIELLYAQYTRQYTKEIYKGLKDATEIAKAKINNQLLTLVGEGKVKALKKIRIGEVDKQLDKILTKLKSSQSFAITNQRIYMYETAYNINRLDIGRMISTPIPYSTLPKDLIERTITDTLPYLDVGTEIGRNVGAAKQKILNDLVSQLMTGEAYEETAKSIAMHLHGNFERARKIARTELHRVKELGVATSNIDLNENELKEIDTKIYHEWKATADNRTREDHMMVDGQRIVADTESKFRVGQSEGVAPGNLYGIDQAAQNINCRCAVVPVVTGQNTEDLYNPDDVAFKEFKKTEIKNKKDKKNFIEKVKKQQKEMTEKDRYMQEVTPEKRNEIANRLDNALKEKVNATSTVREKMIGAIQRLDYRALNILNENFDEITDSLRPVAGTKQAWYSPTRKTVNLNFNRTKNYYGTNVEDVFFHELGHYLDDNIKIGKRTEDLTQKLAKSLREETMEEVHRAILTYRTRNLMDIDDIKKFTNPMDIRRNYDAISRHRISKIMEGFVGNSSTAGNIQDLWQGATQSAVKCTWGHDLKYYKYMGGKDVDELYAHFFQMTVLDDQVELLETFFPKTYKIWKDNFAGGVFK